MSEGQDITALRAALAKTERARDAAIADLDAARATHRAGLGEAQHRLRNSISVIRAIVHRAADETDDVADYCGLLDARLTAYLNVQAVVAIDPRSGIDLELLIMDELLKFGLAGDDRISLDGPPLDLNSRAAGLVGLMFHDLVSRLIVDGFEWSDARLHVGWRSTTNDDVVVEWRVSGASTDDVPTTAWADSLRAAIHHQLAGDVVESRSAAITTTRITLPLGSCFVIA